MSQKGIITLCIVTITCKLQLLRRNTKHVKLFQGQQSVGISICLELMIYLFFYTSKNVMVEVFDHQDILAEYGVGK